jgi:ribosomal protein S18 acetylase RimI-like enzyme
MQVSIRKITSDDVPFLWEMLYYAAWMSKDGHTSYEPAMDDPHLNIYVKEWGKPGDQGVIAFDSKSSRQLGAAWIRLLTEDKSNYGYYDDETPELAIATFPDVTGQGVGSAMLDALFQQARGHVPAIVLTVRSTNPAKRLYERFGFQVIDEVTNRVGTRSIKMLLTLDQVAGRR